MSGPQKSPPKLRGTCCEQRVAIQAPAEAVWAVLADFAGWPAWNPVYVETGGTLAAGEAITVAVALPGMKRQRARATVTAVEPPRLIEFSLRGFGGLLRICRYIDITSTGPASCRVGNGEIMGGPLGRMLARTVGGKVRDGLKAMNEALRARVEQSASV
ncbi:MAG: SRPBCC domain-containing protein [Novosphingobium sp.]